MEIDDLSTILEEENDSLSNLSMGKYLNVWRKVLTRKSNVII
jgi:hypothetical protein